MTTTLPDFDPHLGYLPTGLHTADLNAFHRRCVTELHLSSDHRSPMFAGYRRLIEALELLNLPTEQWIGGSFVSKHPSPNDIDLVNFCDVRAFESLPAELRAMIKRYFAGDETAKHCYCDSYFAPKPPPEHQLTQEFLQIQDYWASKLGSDEIGRDKGMIRCEIAPNTAKEEADAIIA